MYGWLEDRAEHLQKGHGNCKDVAVSFQQLMKPDWLIGSVSNMQAVIKIIIIKQLVKCVLIVFKRWQCVSWMIYVIVKLNRNIL